MRTRVIIHLERFFRNFEAIKTRIGKNRHICVPVKANAYGHGTLKIAKASLEAGAFCLGVAAVHEGVELRKEGIKSPIMLFSQLHPQEIPAIIELQLTPFVSDTWYADSLNEQAKINKTKLPVHIKIDTGMGRLGCSAEEAFHLARHITSCPGLELTGTATHFAVSDSTTPVDIEYTRKQLNNFEKAITAIKDSGIDPGIVHTANSGAVILHPDTWFDMVRPGIFLYGYKTADENNIPGFPFEPLQAEPVMELISNVVLIKKVSKGESISYGRTWTTDRDTNIAILPAGYADGLPRLASGRWQTVINGKSYPIIGRICMDHCCVDIGPETDVRRWDEAVIFGTCAGYNQDAAALAEAVGTIPYEITCNAGKTVHCNK